MITYSARTMDGETITVACTSRDAALDLAEGDLLNGLTPVAMEIAGVRLGIRYILRLVFKRWEGREQGEGVPITTSVYAQQSSQSPHQPNLYPMQAHKEMHR
jgi:hypothetical protein